MLNPRFENVTNFHSFKTAMESVVIYDHARQVNVSEKDIYRTWYILCNARNSISCSFAYQDLLLSAVGYNNSFYIEKIKKILSYIGIIPPALISANFYNIIENSEPHIELYFYDYDFSLIPNWDLSLRNFNGEYFAFARQQEQIRQARIQNLNSFRATVEVVYPPEPIVRAPEVQISYNFHYDFDPFESISQEVFNLLFEESRSDVERFVVQEQRIQDLLRQIDYIPIEYSGIY